MPTPNNQRPEGTLFDSTMALFHEYVEQAERALDCTARNPYGIMEFDSDPQPILFEEADNATLLALTPSEAEPRFLHLSMKLQQGDEPYILEMDQDGRLADYVETHEVDPYGLGIHAVYAIPGVEIVMNSAYPTHESDSNEHASFNALLDRGLGGELTGQEVSAIIGLVATSTPDLSHFRVEFDCE